MFAAVLAVLCFFLASPLRGFAQVPGGPATITFHFSNPALEPPAFTMQVREDGTGHYHSDPGTGPTAGQLPLDRDIQLAEPTRSQLFAAARKNHFFATECPSHAKVAFSGEKTFSYAGADGAGSCTFNYSRIAQLQALSTSLIAVATTLEEGRRLEVLLAHDKLGLDAKMEQLAGEKTDGLAMDFENIAPVLHLIAGDEEVLHRTRSRAESLLGIGPP